MATSSDKPIRIGLDQRLAAYRTAGIARYALELGQALERLDDIDLVPLRHRGDPGASEEQPRLRTPPHHRFEDHLLRLELALYRTGLDLYHATDFVAPRLGNLPAVATVHDLAFMRWPEQLSEDSLAYYRRILDRADTTRQWITPSEWTKRDLIEFVDVEPDRVTVIPHGVPTYMADVGVVPRQDRRPFVLAVGTVEPRKRYDLLLDALDRIEPRIELCIAGQPGWNTDELQRRIRSTPNVTWLRSASDQEVRRLLASATALAMPSIAEGFGLPALEAMACGTPVISSGHGALREVAAEAAVAPDTDDPEGWSDAIRMVLEDGLAWEHASISGLERVRRFDWDHAAAETLAVYRRALG